MNTDIFHNIVLFLCHWVHYGTGRHIPDIQVADIPKALHYWRLCEIFYTVTTVLVRLSIAVFLLRLSIRAPHRYVVYRTLLVVCLLSTFYFFLVLFQYSPVG